ncbi:hypothetical protein F9U64_10550 [Gracilibacillus oryzae]|uniref:Uncharacterized protein n=1 Tax=Gracilibacillus oryzae TaxID=1672701 RepID=A0A7C8KS88_9BACI|nr:hypothetical protein [Gracilibacillus oryzae]KAB8135710.1 hypothetical protein F9U64_10550 [Gracilibacillus oryzae]
MKYQKLFLISFIINIIAVVLVTFFLGDHFQVKETIKQNEQRLFREFVNNQEALKINLRNALQDTDEIDKMELTEALNVNYANLMLSEQISLPDKLEWFSSSLYGYNYQLLEDFKDEAQENSTREELQTIIDTINTYQKALQFDYYDTPEEMRRKFESATEDVIIPFFNNSNPF